MNRILLFVLVLLISNYVFCQNIKIEAGAKYKLDNQLYFHAWNGNGATADTFLVCAKNKVKVTRTLTRTVGTLVIIKLKTIYSYQSGNVDICVTSANKDNTYCIDANVLSNNVTVPEWLPQYGFITVPFKYDIKNSRVYPGGLIGGYFGVQKRLNWTPTESMSWFLIGSAGYSRIALNNTNIQNVDPSNTTFADAFTYGIATGFQISRFQIMVMWGSDRYNANGDKEAINWLSVGFGFGFIKPPSEQ